MKLADVMGEPRLKVELAQKQIQELERVTVPALSRDLFELAVLHRRHHAFVGKRNAFSLEYRPRVQLSHAFGAIIGNVFCNLRASLDCWMNNAVACVAPKREVRFPFSADLQKLKETRDYVAVEASFPAVGAFILQTVRPCADANRDLWSVARMSDRKTSSECVPALAIAAVENLDVYYSGIRRIAGHAFAGDPDHAIRIVPEAAEPVSTNDAFRIVVDQRFAPGSLFEGEPVLPAMARVASAVTRTLDQLEEFVRPHCT